MSGEPAEECARFRPLDGQHGVGARHVRQVDAGIGVEVALHPDPVARLSRGRGDDEVAVLVQTVHREVAFDAATPVQHVGVNQLARRHVDVAG
jgi:hypothetical protein